MYNQSERKFCSVQGGGFVSRSPHKARSQNRFKNFNRAQPDHSDDKSRVYAVKYLGIVDGNMGILSHKAVMRGLGNYAVNKETSSLIKDL